MYGDRIAPFKAVDGIRFWSGSEPYDLVGGQYGGGNGAIQIECGGSLSMTLTVNLVNGPSLSYGEFFVKASDRIHVGSIQQSLIRLGIFQEIESPDFIPQGFVADYAKRWRFGDCNHSPLTFKVECETCREEIAKEFEEGKHRLLARDAVKRLRAMKGTDL